MTGQITTGDRRGPSGSAGFGASVTTLACILAIVTGGAGTAKAEGMFTGENVGKAVGAVAGALVGSRIGEGRGKVAAVAAGTLAGYWVGGKVGRSLTDQDRSAITGTTEQALATGESQSWRNPDTGVYTNVSVQDDTGPGRGMPSLPEALPLEYINAYYTPSSNVNVRGGPGTDYGILHGLKRGERVPVLGKVMGRDWYMIAEGGEGSGFVYAPLFARSDVQAVAGNAIREASGSGELPQTYTVAESQCRRITQEVVLPSGEREEQSFRACRQADGRWVQV